MKAFEESRKLGKGTHSWSFLDKTYNLKEEDRLMEFQDKTLTCTDCGKEFTFTSGEQSFYKEKGFQNEPTRCPECRLARRRDRNTHNRREKKLYNVTCASCGQPTQVPFEPRQGRPVYCKDCFTNAQV